MFHRGDLTYMGGRRRGAGDRTAFGAWANTDWLKWFEVQIEGVDCVGLWDSQSLLDWSDYRNQNPVKSSPRSLISLEWEGLRCHESDVLKLPTWKETAPSPVWLLKRGNQYLSPPRTTCRWGAGRALSWSFLPDATLLPQEPTPLSSNKHLCAGLS